MNDTVIVIPAYEAALTLTPLFQRLPKGITPRLLRIVVVDDGSSDGTWETIQHLCRSWPLLRPLRNERNRGYGGALKRLFAAALEEPECKFVVVLHADGQYAPELLPEMMAPIEASEADLTQGSRMLGGGALKGGMPLYKYLANRVLTWIENRAFKLKLAEYHSGYMAYARPFLDSVPWQGLSDSFDFDLEMIALARANGYRIKEVPIPTHYGGEVSHLRSIPYGLRVLRVVARYLRGDYRLKQQSYEEQAG